MVQHLIDQFRKAGQLLITEVQYDDYNLLIMGTGWTLNTTSSWRILSNGELLGNYDSKTKAELKSLIGESIISINQIGDVDIDFSLSFSDGKKLQVFSNSNFEPWIFAMDGETVLVAAYK